MAEGDVIHRLARQIDRALGGQGMRASCPHPRGRAGALDRLDGRRLEAAEARGKHLLLHFYGGLVLHSHLGMKGSWDLYRDGERWRKPSAAPWLVLGGGGCEAVQWGGPTLRLLRPDELARDPRLGRLGPDLLAEDFSLRAATRALRRAEYGIELGDGLLDQRLLAGIGNVFKSEGCFAAGVSPWRRIVDLSEPELESTLAATRELMLGAVASGRQPREVYGRAPRPCPRCGAQIRSRRQGDAARTTFWCEACQA
jgi:endonuclease VIII